MGSKRKKCSECGKRRALSKFDDRKNSKDGKKSFCVDCRYLIRLKSQYRYSDYKYNATRRKLAFKISLAQFKDITSQPCYYCGGYSGQGYTQKYNGIDRISSNRGYVENNCVASCAACNYMKRHTNTKDFLQQVKKISEHHQLTKKR